MHAHEKRFLGFLLRHMAYGATGGFVFGAFLLAQDFANIRSMAMGTDTPFLWFFMLFFGLFITFGSLGIGVGVMLIPYRRDLRR
ncbi:MAG: hypothetical protein KDA64_04315 [Rhodospirillaceae bacterium]|nr:hypothetical protein [Rhodospirillaceae bacterium]